jgi:hypothetical protein
MRAVGQIREPVMGRRAMPVDAQEGAPRLPEEAKVFKLDVLVGDRVLVEAERFCCVAAGHPNMTVIRPVVT